MTCAGSTLTLFFSGRWWRSMVKNKKTNWLIRMLPHHRWLWKERMRKLKVSRRKGSDDERKGWGNWRELEEREEMMKKLEVCYREEREEMMHLKSLLVVGPCCGRGNGRLPSLVTVTVLTLPALPPLTISTRCCSPSGYWWLPLTAARRCRLLPIDTAIVTPQPSRPKPPAHRGPLRLQLTQLRFSMWAILIMLAHVVLAIIFAWLCVQKL